MCIYFFSQEPAQHCTPDQWIAGGNVRLLAFSSYCSELVPPYGRSVSRTAERVNGLGGALISILAVH